jgi:hypothetical protein
VRRAIIALVVVAVAVGCGSHEPTVAVTRSPPPPRLANAAWCPDHSVATLDARRLVGQGEYRARVVASRNGCYVQVMQRDGRYVWPFTADYLPTRIRVAVDHHKVSGVYYVG